MNINATLIVQIIVFILLVLFTMKVVWPPVATALDEPIKKVADGLAAADKAKAELSSSNKRVEDVRVAAAQLGGDPGGDIVDVERGDLVLLRNARVEDDLQQDVPEFLGHVVAFTRLDRLDRLVGLLDEVGHERGVGLLGVPRAAAGRAQPVHDRDQVQQRRAGWNARAWAARHPRSVTSRGRWWSGRSSRAWASPGSRSSSPPIRSAGRPR